MEQNNINPQQQQVNQSRPLTYSTSILVLGILSIVLCWCYGIIGIALAIIALVQANKASEEYKKNPTIYTMSSLNNMKAGKTCAIIGLILSSIYLVWIIIYVIIIGAAMTLVPWDMFQDFQYF